MTKESTRKDSQPKRQILDFDPKRRNGSSGNNLWNIVNIIDTNTKLTHDPNATASSTNMKPDFNLENALGSAESNTTRSVLDRVKAFLPQLAEANKQMQKQRTDTPSHDNKEDDENQVIEMTIGLVKDKQIEDGESSKDEEEERIKMPGDCTRKAFVVDSGKDENIGSDDASDLSSSAFETL